MTEPQNYGTVPQQPGPGPGPGPGGPAYGPGPGGPSYGPGGPGYGPGPGPGPGPVPPQSKPRSMKKRRIIALVVLVLVVGGIGIAAWSSSKSSPDAAGVNDCVSKSGANSIKTVSCSDSSAAFRVVGKVEHKTQAAVSINSATICKPYPTAKTAYWRGEVGKEGYVLCLAPLK